MGSEFSVGRRFPPAGVLEQSDGYSYPMAEPTGCGSVASVVAVVGRPRGEPLVAVESEPAVSSVLTRPGSGPYRGRGSLLSVGCP
ncbi:MAG: hypothetical protein ACJAYU_000591 [Bradymonadia bacterium]|jgi:hypothetical protein